MTCTITYFRRRNAASEWSALALYTWSSGTDSPAYRAAFGWRPASTSWCPMPLDRVPDEPDGALAGGEQITSADLARDLPEAARTALPVISGPPRLQVQRARELAITAHAGQVDKNGAPYHLHPEAVAAAFDSDTEPVECAAAWLHDVLEDTAIDAGGLRAHGIQEPVIAVVELLTRHADLPDAVYYARIRDDPAARRVKLADIAHNTRPDRVARLDEPTRRRLVAKYAKARAALGVDDRTSQE